MEFTRNGAEAFTRYFSMQDFGTFHIFYEDDDLPKDAISVDPDSPPWLIHKEDFEAVQAMHRRMVKYIADAKDNENLSEDDAEKRTVTFTGFAVASKIIVLIQMLLISYNYYNVKTEKYPGFKPSALFDKELTPDLYFALFMYQSIMLKKYDKLFYVTASLKSDIYTVAKMLIDLLGGWILGPEVDDLRNAYTVFHNSRIADNALDILFDKLKAVSVRFSKEEPKWERERAASPYKAPHPLLQGVGDFQQMASPLHGATKRRKPHYRCSNKQAAEYFGVAESTIGHWRAWCRDKEAKNAIKPPDDFPRHDATPEQMEFAAAKYNTRICL